MPDLTLDSCACAVSHLPSYFLLSISCHLNPWVLDCCHLYLPYPLAICQTIQPSVLLWSSEILHLNFSCSDQGPLASSLESQTDNLFVGISTDTKDVQKIYTKDNIFVKRSTKAHTIRIYCGFVCLVGNREYN